MKYLVLIYGSETQDAKLTEGDMKHMMNEYFAYSAAMKEAKVLLAGEGLKPIATATTVRVRNGKTTHTDGPFAETKEQLGGFYLIETPNLEKALEWGAKCPGAKHGSVEVRPVMDYA